jgi:acetolactate synthase-1/3 small subunit
MMRRRTFIALLENQPGALARITSLLRRRSYEVISLAVGPSKSPGVSRMSLVIQADDDDASRLEANLHKLVNVLRVQDVSDLTTVSRELTLIKVLANMETRPQVLQIAETFRARVVDVGTEALILENTGTSDKLDGLLDVLSAFGVIELVRTGAVTMVRSAEASNFFLPSDGRETRRRTEKKDPLPT